MYNILFIGDGGYPIRKFLLTPLLNPNNRAEQLYNQSQIRTRNKIECAFGIVKRRFPVLAYGCRLNIQTTLNAIVATSVLYNIARHRNDPEIRLDPAEEEILQALIDEGNIPQAVNRVGNDSNYRNHIIRDYFANL